jgi:hypothetical protein
MEKARILIVEDEAIIAIDLSTVDMENKVRIKFTPKFKD